MQSQKMPKKKQVKKFLLYYLVIIRISQFLSAEKHKHVKMIFAIWLSLFSWTKIEFNKEKRHLIGDHIFAEENIYWSINSKQETLVPKKFSFELKKNQNNEHNFRVPLIERIGNDFWGTFFGIFFLWNVSWSSILSRISLVYYTH